MHYSTAKSYLSSLSFILMLSVYNPVSADYVAGEEANGRGDRATAFTEFYNAAQNHDTRAYGKLGSMYLYGLGTEKNYQSAFIWFHMAYLAGEREGERFRDAASSTMTREQYLKAVDLAEAERVRQKLGTAPPQSKPPSMKK